VDAGAGAADVRGDLLAVAAAGLDLGGGGRARLVSLFMLERVGAAGDDESGYERKLHREGERGMEGGERLALNDPKAKGHKAQVLSQTLTSLWIQSLQAPSL
jgi:hypothetical protein